MLRRAGVRAVGSDDDQAVHSGRYFISELVSPSNAKTSESLRLVPDSPSVRCTHFLRVDNQEMQTVDCLGLSLTAAAKVADYRRWDLRRATVVCSSICCKSAPKLLRMCPLPARSLRQQLSEPALLNLQSQTGELF